MTSGYPCISSLIASQRGNKVVRDDSIEILEPCIFQLLSHPLPLALWSLISKNFYSGVLVHNDGQHTAVSGMHMHQSFLKLVLFILFQSRLPLKP